MGASTSGGASLIPGTNAGRTGRYLAAAGLVCKADDSDCDREWREAMAECTELIREQREQDAGRKRPRHIRGVTGGYYNVMQCAKGLVSERCGGNKIDR